MDCTYLHAWTGSVPHQPLESITMRILFLAGAVLLCVPLMVDAGKKHIVALLIE